MSEQFIIDGSSRLSGTISVSGAKNHALKIIPACLLSATPVTIEQVPRVEDVLRLIEIIEDIGAGVNWIDQHTIIITPPASFSGALPEALVPRLRASVVLLGPLLARYGAVTLPHPGGDAIGRRPINFFIDGLRQFGAEIEEQPDRIVCQAPNGLRGTSYVFPTVSVTGTETLLLGALLAQGETVLHNAALEPEVIALAQQLVAWGAQISGIGTTTLRIQGGGLLEGDRARVIPDRIEAGSLMILAAATRSSLRVTNCIPDHLTVPITLLQQMGIQLASGIDDSGEGWIEVVDIPELLRPVDVITHEYPGFPTDLQSPMTVLLTQVSGQSMVRETIYDGRLFFTDSLNAMGAHITLQDPYRAIVQGPTVLHGRHVASPDIRAGLAMIIAGLIADGQTTISNIYQIDRGYEQIELRLASIGARIRRTATA